MHDRYGGRLLLDANLVVALWGAISLFGVLVALLIPRTDQNYQTFLDVGSPEAYQRARTWAFVTRSVPLLSKYLTLSMNSCDAFTHCHRHDSGNRVRASWDLSRVVAA